MTSRLTLPALLLAATAVPAHAGQDALQRLYQQAEKRAEATSAAERNGNAGARERFGKYDPRTTAMSGQVRSVLHVHRTPDGRLVTVCRTEYPGRGLEHEHGVHPPREQR